MLLRPLAEPLPLAPLTPDGTRMGDIPSFVA
jgi:hypothetical protein